MGLPAPEREPGHLTQAGIFLLGYMDNLRPTKENIRDTKWYHLPPSVQQTARGAFLSQIIFKYSCGKDCVSRKEEEFYKMYVAIM